jgi:hypothetical protein
MLGYVPNLAKDRCVITEMRLDSGSCHANLSSLGLLAMTKTFLRQVLPRCVSLRSAMTTAFLRQGVKKIHIS